jgi:hypothetical protein
MRSVTVNCSALTPESHSQPTAEPRPASTGSKWFAKAERSSCGTARLCSAAMPESNCRRCLEQDFDVLIRTWMKSEVRILRTDTRPSYPYVHLLHAVMQSHRAAVPSGTSTWLGDAGRNGGGVPSRVDPAAVDMGPFDPCAMASICAELPSRREPDA